MLWRLAQRNLFGLGEAFALALSDPLALARDRLHALLQTFAREQRHDQRIGRRAHGDGREQHGHEAARRGACRSGIESCCTSQKSKLIIFFITKMPMDIHTTQPTSINCPVGWVHSSEMY